MNRLFIDTSTKYLCIGIAKDEKVIYKFQQEAIKKQSELTIPFLQKALKENKAEMLELLGVEPGSVDQVMQAGRNPEVQQLVDNLFDSAPQDLKPVLLMFVVAFICVDESVNRGEYEYIQKLLA